MDDQKVLKKRLKALMNRPENQVCADCPERQPRWASLIVVPPGAPAGAQPIGAFVCLECSGSHRRLGVHIAFVRSINLDSWKEKEVLAMENGGNARVNAVFEPNLSNPSIKPHNHADGPTRERFIRDKYERRKYYDPNGFLTPLSSAPALPRTQSSMSSGGGSEHEQSLRRESFGPPSDAARQRLEERRQRIKSNAPGTLDRTSSGLANATNRKKTTIAKTPVSAPPPSVDLLDFGATAESNTTTQQNVATDFFGSDNTFTANFDNAVSAPAPAPAQLTTSAPSNGGGGLDMFEFLTKDLKTTNQAPATENRQQQQPANSFGGDIMSLYASNGTQQQAWGNANVPQLSTAMAGMGLGNNMGMQQQQQAYGMNGGQNQQQMMMMMQQQQQQQRNQMMYSMNNGNMSGNPMMMQSTGNPMGMQNNMMGQNSGMNNMMMQGNTMQQQNAFNMPGYGGGSGVNNGGGFNNNNFNSGGFGAPMGAGPPISSFSSGNHDAGNKSKKPATPEKDDPFAQFGMNVFRT